MPILTGHYDTPNAAKYLTQLCKHFAHKVAVENDDTTGVVHFAFGPARLGADDTRLTVSFAPLDDGALETAKHVIESHLVTFAFREGFTTMDWTIAPSTAPAI